MERNGKMILDKLHDYHSYTHITYIL